MKETFPDLPGWTFDIREVSAGMYEVVVTDTNGYFRAKMTGQLDDLILKHTREFIHEMLACLKE